MNPLLLRQMICSKEGAPRYKSPYEGNIEEFTPWVDDTDEQIEEYLSNYGNKEIRKVLDQYSVDDIVNYLWFKMLRNNVRKYGSPADKYTHPCWAYMREKFNTLQMRILGDFPLTKIGNTEKFMRE